MTAPVIIVCTPASVPHQLPSYERRCRCCERPVWVSMAMEADIPAELVPICEPCAGITSHESLQRFIEDHRVHVRRSQLRLLDQVSPTVAASVREHISAGRAVLDE